MLMTLPSIGRRMAQQVIAELKGQAPGVCRRAEPARAAATKFKPFQAEALEILVAWGEKRNEAMEIDRAGQPEASRGSRRPRRLSRSSTASNKASKPERHGEHEQIQFDRDGENSHVERSTDSDGFAGVFFFCSW